ncbi:MAG: hypothetical protein DIZ80_10150 [endosymbiont of Galathealinum brachiosum]|uniref:Paraquat-inducible protein A n=1 Tax=endosymbiont of Galathealinum brachiosum TaxID=2200906 RepID=A0A370DE25_9GAMM|nr:MAG: hypothetical protein DIZ80_10150 [endosymbiont of Galathealinum brachiosum]
MVCHECDALQDVSHIPEGETGLCLCCGERLFKNPKSAIEKPLALMMACVILFIVANSYPLLHLEITGIERAVTITESAIIFYTQDSPELAMVVFLTSVVFPGFCVFSLFYVLISIHLKKQFLFVRPLLVWVGRLIPWGMMDVFLLAILVALVKLAALAHVVLGLGFIAFVALVVCYAAAVSSIEMHVLWSKLEKI